MSECYFTYIKSHKHLWYCENISVMKMTALISMSDFCYY